MDKKKIIVNVKKFIKANWLSIITLFLIFQIIFSFKDSPYLNLIVDFYIYALLITLIIGYFLLLKYFTAKRLVIAAIIFLIISFPFLVFHQEGTSTFLGFIVFVLLLGAVFITVSRERGDLRA